MTRTQKSTPASDGKPRRPRWRRWLRRVGIALGVLLLLFAVFHRWIFFEGTRYFIIRAAKQQHLELDYKISGSIFTTLHIAELKGTPLESGAIQRLEIGAIDLQYSLPGLIREGPHAFLKTLEAKDVFVELTPAEKPPPEKDAEKQSIKFPALFPERLVLQNVNFTSHGKKGDTVLDSLDFTLFPDKPGALKLNVLDIPGVRRWEGVSARTSYAGRNLVFEDLVIGPEIALMRFNLDASNLEKKELALNAQGRVFTSQSSLTAKVTDLNKTNHLDLTIGSTGGLVLDDLWAYLNIQPPMHGRAQELDFTFQGEPLAPKTWSAGLKAKLLAARFKDHQLGDQTLGIWATPPGVDVYQPQKEGHAVVKLDGVWDQGRDYQLTASIPLPETTGGFKDAPIEGVAQLQLNGLEPIAKLLPAGTTGDVVIFNTGFRLADGRISLKDALLRAASLNMKSLRLADFRLEVAQWERSLRVPEGRPFFATMRGQVSQLKGKVGYGAYDTDQVDAQLAIDEAKVTVGKLLITKGQNRVSASGEYLLPADNRSWLNQPGDVKLSINAPELSAFLAPGSTEQLAGTLTVEGSATQKTGGSRDGNFVVAGKDLAARGLKIRTLDGQFDLIDNQAQVRELNAVLDDRNEVMIGGMVLLQAPYTYDASVDVQLKDLNVLRPVLPAKDGARPELAGALMLTWSGQGQTGQPMRHSGQAKIDLANGVYGTLTGISAQGNVTYTPATISAPDLQLAATGLPRAALALDWRDQRLKITQLTLREGETTLVEGNADVPLHLSEFRDPRRLIPRSEPFELKLQTRQLNFAQLLTAAKQKPDLVPATGSLTMDLDAKGTLDAPRADLALKVTQLKATNPPASGLAPAEIDLNASLLDKRLALTGEARQPKFSPLRITGNMPLDLAAIQEKRALDPATPIEASFTMPRTDLAVLEGLAPQVRESRGTAEADVRVSGTVGEPRLSGQAAADLTLLRFTDPSLPPVDNLSLAVAFLEKQVTLNRLSGRVAGGNVQANGQFDLTDAKNPLLNVQLAARNALVMQNDDLTVRASTDLRVVGPLNSAAVTGAVYVTRSRFFRDIDILPIGLPGRPAPKPPADPRVISFPNPPLRDWTFDVAIRTADPFLIQGNLARGEAVGDLKLGGTGLEPYLEGNIHISKFTASLPFSRLEMEEGLIYFQRDRPFIPLLNLRAHSTIREHEVRAYVYGPASSPTAVFSSDPPLPQSEVVSLLATGTTTEELGSDPNALAGRGAVLLFQKLYRSVFKKGAPTDNLTDNTFLENVQFEVGSTDPATGQSGANIRIPMARNVVLAGGVDVSGNFRGQVKYLVRFK